MLKRSNQHRTSPSATIIRKFGRLSGITESLLVAVKSPRCGHLRPLFLRRIIDTALDFSNISSISACIMVIRTPTTKDRIIAYRFHPSDPKPIKWIAEEEKMPESTVSGICAHWQQHGHVYPLPRSGRPRALTKRGEGQLIGDIQADPKAGFDVFGEKHHISDSTVRRVAHKYGFHSRICHKKPMISAVNRTKRVAWAKENDGQAFGRIMYTDEACFHVGETGRERVIRRPGTEFEP